MVFRPYPWGLESLTVCRRHNKGSTFFLSYFKTLNVGPRGGLNRRLRPPAHQNGALWPNWANKAAVSRDIQFVKIIFKMRLSNASNWIFGVWNLDTNFCTIFHVWIYVDSWHCMISDFRSPLALRYVEVPLILASYYTSSSSPPCSPTGYA